MPLFFTTKKTPSHPSKKSSHRFFSFDPHESINKKSLQRIRSRKKLRYLPKTNIAPENGPSQKETRIPTIHFQVRTLSFREGRYSKMDGLWKMHLRLQICRAIPGIYASNFVFREGKNSLLINARGTMGFRTRNVLSYVLVLEVVLLAISTLLTWPAKDGWWGFIEGWWVFLRLEVSCLVKTGA